MHHIAFEVEDIKLEIIRLKKCGFTVINEVPKKGADNKLICFLHANITRKLTGRTHARTHARARAPANQKG